MRSILALLALAPSLAFKTPLRPRLRNPTKPIVVAPAASYLDSITPEPKVKRAPLAPRLGGFASLVVLDEICRAGLKGSGLPHSLCGGAALVAALIAGGGPGLKLHSKLLAPGSALLLSWMPVFFAPSLVLLPLAQPVVGTARDALALGVVVVSGLLASLASTAYIVDAASKGAKPPKAADAFAAPAGPAVPFGSPLFKPLAAATAASGVLALRGVEAALRPYFLASTLAAFVGGTRLSGVLKSSKKSLYRTLAKVLHPVAVCAAVSSVFCALLPTAKEPTLKAYAALAGAPLQRLLGASVLALGCGVYGRRKEVAANWKPVAASTVGGVGVGMFGTAALARAAGLPAAAKYSL
eukprot:CAMPEP_0119270120 /NCGR_PEP_ID=MMETSP1329-20130426/7246_1 /TAXON_ID=114041 /ORGANISM="Genus nov. species nov., Strain RCC1024" /LENGTH=353 /DNA_ID=CAMNT_0007270129 /DNA_START=89 /DNA_END=1147 /DNA_ORIENTATION=+